jgi:hypothetical protein
MRFFCYFHIEGASFIESYNIRMMLAIFHLFDHDVVNFYFLKEQWKLSCTENLACKMLDLRLCYLCRLLHCVTLAHA